jgi:polar amino acid transport system ATP-binding protein
LSASGNGATPFVDVDNVCKWFGDLQVLDRVSLQVAEHGVVCLIGASGSGKSTLLRCINMLERVEEGEITVDGQSLTKDKVDVNAIRKKIGIVFQAYNLFPHMTVLQNVMLAPRKARRVPRDEAEWAARTLLSRIGLEAKADEFPDRLSGGQQQRVAIVRALAMQPKLMLLDEITSALDPQLVSEVLGLVRELADSGMTMILATHEMAFAREVSDKVCFLDGGRILEEAPPDQIFSDPREPRTREFLSRVLAGGRMQ